MLNIVLLGAPGSGKGTQSRYLCERHGFVEFDAGSVLADWCRGDRPEQVRLQQDLDRGLFAPTPLMMRIYREWLEAQQENAKVLSSGIPRGDQTEIFFSEVAKGAYPCDGLIWLDVDADTIADRVRGRLTCTACGAIYHVSAFPPETEGHCACGSPLVKRAMDTDEAAQRKRVEMFFEKTLPVRAAFLAHGIAVFDIDGRREAHLVARDVELAVAQIASRTERLTHKGRTEHLRRL